MTSSEAETRPDHLPPPRPESSTSMAPLKLPPNIHFGPFAIAPSQIFHLSPSRLTYGLVNLKPLLPGHILICPVRRAPRLLQLTDAETTDLFQTVRRVSRTLERLYGAAAFNVAVQDGVEAGQSVPHVHVHVIPRRTGDLRGPEPEPEPEATSGHGDQLYEWLDGDEGNLGAEFVDMQARRARRVREVAELRDRGGFRDEGRCVRSEEEMAAEAEWLRREMELDRRAPADDSDAGGRAEH